MTKELVIYETSGGKRPFALWLSKLKDSKGRAKIQTRLNRLASGHYGDVKNVGEGVSELRIAYGPGYRVYYAELKTKLVIVLLLAGTKSGQSKDIAKAKEHWRSYKKRYEDE